MTCIWCSLNIPCTNQSQTAARRRSVHRSSWCWKSRYPGGVGDSEPVVSWGLAKAHCPGSFHSWFRIDVGSNPCCIQPTRIWAPKDTSLLSTAFLLVELRDLMLFDRNQELGTYCWSSCRALFPFIGSSATWSCSNDFWLSYRFAQSEALPWWTTCLGTSCRAKREATPRCWPSCTSWWWDSDWWAISPCTAFKSFLDRVAALRSLTICTHTVLCFSRARYPLLQSIKFLSTLWPLISWSDSHSRIVVLDRHLWRRYSILV